MFYIDPLTPRKNGAKPIGWDALSTIPCTRRYMVPHHVYFGHVVIGVARRGNGWHVSNPRYCITGDGTIACAAWDFDTKLEPPLPGWVWGLGACNNNSRHKCGPPTIYIGLTGGARIRRIGGIPLPRGWMLSGTWPPRAGGRWPHGWAGWHWIWPPGN